MRAILRSLTLCSAFALPAAQAAQPSADTITRGEALVVAGDCTSCHTADPARRPFVADGHQFKVGIFQRWHLKQITSGRSDALGNSRCEFWATTAEPRNPRQGSCVVL